MILLLVFLICLFLTLGAGMWAALSDVRGMVIPNACSLIVIGSFFLAYGVLWAFGRDDVFAPLGAHLISALIVFLITLVMFMLRGIGGGDSKLGTAFALWMGLKGLVPFVFYMSVIGGILGLVALALRKWKPLKSPKTESWVARVQAGESRVPYGVAIVAGALVSFAKLGYLGWDVFSSFLLS